MNSRAHDPKENTINEGPKGNPISEDPKEDTVTLLNRILSLSTLRRTLSPEPTTKGVLQVVPQNSISNFDSKYQTFTFNKNNQINTNITP